MKLLSLLKVKRTLVEEIKFQIEDVIDTIMEFFIMIKENTYDVLFEKYGSDIDVALLMGATLIIMIVAVTIINGHGKQK